MADDIDPVDVIHQKIHLATEALEYIGARPLDPGYDPLSEGDSLELQRHHFIDVLDDLNVQLALVLANENAVEAPTQEQIEAVIAATTAVENLNKNQAIGSTSLDVLNAGFAAAQPLLKA
jgi:hypothetical protein